MTRGASARAAGDYRAPADLAYPGLLNTTTTYRIPTLPVAGNVRIPVSLDAIT